MKLIIEEKTVENILGVALLVQMFIIGRLLFKIGYYEQKLKNRGIIDGVKGMPIYKLFM